VQCETNVLSRWNESVERDESGKGGKMRSQCPKIRSYYMKQFESLSSMSREKGEGERFPKIRSVNGSSA
jgi:hypothetical protein